MGAAENLLAPLGETEFQIGVAVGAVTLVPVAAAGVIARRRAAGPVPVIGLAIAVAALVGVGVDRAVPALVIAAVAVLAAGGLVADVLGLPAVAVVALAAPGTVLLVSADGVEGATWRQLAVGCVVIAGSALVAAFDRRWARQAWAPLLFACSVAGMYATVPDTEEILVLFGASAALAVAGWPLRLARLGAGGASAAIGAAAWIVCVGGAGRDGSVVGACFCLGMLAVDPLVRMLGGRSPLRGLPDVDATVIIVVTHVVLVLWASRVAGLEQGAGAALVWATVGFVVAAVAWGAAGTMVRARRSSGRRRARRA